MDGVPERIYPPEGLQRPTFYKIHEQLGEGTYGKVYRVSSSIQNQQFALKIIHLTADLIKDEREKLNMLREISILASITHKNVIKYYDSWQTDDNVYIVTEYYQNLDLWTYVEREGTPSEPQLIEWIRQLASALKHLQERKIFHRNVTPKNIMVSGDLTLKLGDFGTAKQLSSGDVTDTVVGAPYYMCPEMLRQDPYNVKADIWSLGCVCYYLMTGRVLHEGEVFESLQRSARTGTNLDKLACSKLWSDDLKVLVIQMLSQEPEDRPTVDSILTLTLTFVVTENTNRPSSFPTQSEDENLEQCDSTTPLVVTHEIRNKEDLDVQSCEERQGENQVIEEDCSNNLCELNIQQDLCKILGIDVYMAGLSCLLEPDVNTAMEYLKNAIGEENFHQYFLYFLILLAIRDNSDSTIIRNTLKAMQKIR